MNSTGALGIYLIIGMVGGIIGEKLKIPAGAMIGSMLAVILFKFFSQTVWPIPKEFGFVLQVFLGVMVAASFHPNMLKSFGSIAVPVMVSTFALVGVGVVLSILFARLGLLDFSTAYLGTSPGAMSALIVLALDSDASPTIVTCFHFFRVVFIVLTAPFIFKLLS